MPEEFKPNIYPIMYWALAFGSISGVVLFLVNVLAQYINVIWFPVFLAGLTWGAYRNYRQQKQQWIEKTGTAAAPTGSALEEFTAAARDIVNVSRTLMSEQQAEDKAEQTSAESLATSSEATPAGSASQQSGLPTQKDSGNLERPTP